VQAERAEARKRLLPIPPNVSGKLKNERMDDTNEILGQKIHNIKLLTCIENSNFTRVEKISVDFGLYQLILEVDVDLDEIKTKIVKNFEFTTISKRNKIIESNEIDDFGLHELVNKKLKWLWIMTNNQGYQDGVQLELEGHISIQFMVESSNIWIKKLTEIKIPCR
jgi:hypothetical protein